MTDEQKSYKQSRKQPSNPLAAAGFNPEDAEAVMERIKEMEKHVPATDPMSRYTGGKVPGSNEEVPFNVEGNVPSEFAAMFKKDGSVAKQRQTQEAQMQQQAASAAGPRLADTNNPKLNELLEGIKERTAQYEEVRLPSRSRFYQNGEAPEDGIIHARPMTGQEEEILGTQRLLKKGHAINMIFRNCVRENINPEKWLTTDRTHLLIYLRGISMGPIYQVELRCPLCTHRYEANLDLDSLMVNYCPKEYGSDNLRGVLPVTNYKFSFRFATVSDEAMINNYVEKRKKNDGDGMHADDTFFWRTALLLEEIEGLNEHAALMTLLERLPIADVNHLRYVMNDCPFGVDTKIPQWCPNCNEDFDVELPFDVNFFFPQPKKANRPRQSN